MADYVREVFILNSVEQELQGKILTLDHSLHSSVAALMPYWDKNGQISKHHTDQAFIARNDLGKLFLPYLKWSTNSSTMNEGRQLSADEYKRVWEANFGSLSDPNTVEHIKKVEEACIKAPTNAEWLTGS